MPCVASQWNQVKTEFAGDETTNFGPRQETGTALYQVDTVATISTSDQAAVKVENLKSAALGELVCVGVDHHLNVFNDSQHVTTIAFENLVEDYAWSPDGSLLVVVDSGGKLHLFNAESLHSIISYNLLPARHSDGRAFHKIAFKSDEELKTCDLVLLSASGILFVVKGFSLSAFSDGGDNAVSVVGEQLQFRQTQTRDVHAVASWDAVPLGSGMVLTLGGGDSVMALWQWHDDGIVLQDSVSDVFDNERAIVKAKLTSNNKFLFTLDELNEMYVWLVPELVVVSNVSLQGVGSEDITDFLLLETQGPQSHSLAGVCVVVLVRDVLSSRLHIRSMKSGEDVYTLQLDAHTTLSTCPTIQESLYVVEGTSVLGDADKVSTVRLRCLTETDPETRLKRILHKKRFEEALQFARLFQLDTELVYTAQMNQLLEQLSAWNVVCYDDSQVQDMLSQLWTSVQHVKDCQRVAENCMRAALPSFSHTWKLLQLCQHKLSSGPAETERHQALLTKVLDLQHRLLTFKLAYGAEAYSASSWSAFQQANLLHLVCREMAHHPPHMALVVWKRHCEDWCDQMSVEIVQQFLSIVAERLTLDGVTEWLKDDLLPYLARFQPKAMGEVVQWAVHKATNMQDLDQRGWPQNAIKFLETIDGCVKEITEVNFTTTTDTAVDTATKTQIEVFGVLAPLCSTLSMLYQLNNLLQYNLRLSINQFQQETKETLAFRMLDRVVMVELMKPTLEKYITPYITAHNLDPNHVFATYIKDLLERLGHVRSYTGQSAWEDKVLAIVSFIHNPKEKCCAVLNVIKHAPLPWSPEIQQLVEEGFKIQHPLVQELREAKKIADVRQIMQEYGLKTSIVPNRCQAEKLAIYIAEQNRDKCLEDAQQVLKEYNINTPSSVHRVYFRHANVLISSGKVGDYLRLLQWLERGEARRVGEEVLTMAVVTLDISLPQLQLDQMIKEHKEHYTRAAIQTCQYLLRMVTDLAEQEDLNSQLKVFSSLLKLQSEYQISLSVSEYSDEVERSTVFANFTQRYLRENKPFQASGDLTLLYRLADLLKLQRETVQGELAVLEARAGNWSAVLFLCRELLKAEASKEVAKVLHRVVSALLQLQGQTSRDGDADDSTNRELCRHLPVVLEQLANHAVCMCDTDMMMSCLELSKAAQMWKQVGSQCEASDSVSPLWDMEERKPACKDPLQVYSLDTMYEDEALVMNSTIALPLSATSLAALPSIALDDDEDEEEQTASAPVQKALCCLQPLISHLRDNSHHQQALRFFIVTSAALRESLLQQDMGFPLSTEVRGRLEAQRCILQESEKRGVQLFHSLLSSLLLKVLNAHRVDHKMALAYLLSAPRKVSIDCLMKSIASCNFNFRKLRAIASVGQVLGQLLRESKLISTCQDLETNAAWGVRLSKLKISFKEAFQGGVSAKHEVIGAMARSEHTDVNLVTHFSQDFKMEVENSLLVYLEELLKQSPSAHQLGRAKTVVAAVEAQDRSDFLLTKLKALYKQANAYDYEVIEFLLEELNRMDAGPVYTKGLKLVTCLKMYTRRHPPSSTELSAVSTPGHKEECGDMGETLPEWSTQRVPFHPLLEGEAWRVITPELDAESIPQWKPIAELLELSSDELYMTAVQNIVRRHVSHTTSAPTSHDMGSVRGREKGNGVSVHSWQVSETSLEMLQQAQLLLNCVKKCEMALACANWVVRELPMGGDKILGLQGCVEFSRRWYTECEEHSPQKEKARLAMSKFQKVLCKVLTEQTLHLNHLTDPQLLQLVASPHDLITQLTQHHAVVSQSQQGPVPDVYSTVQKVCEVNGLDEGQVLVTTITKWLLTSDSSEDADTTMNLSFSNLKMTEEALEADHDDNIKRVLYFLQRGPRPHMLKFLINTVQTGEGECTSHLGRMKCLYCLLQIATDADLQLLGLSCHAIREMLRMSYYLTQLEELHIHHSMQTLRDCNKTGLVRAIWRNHKHQKSAVKLTGNLCLDYKLYDRTQWAALLQQMTSLNMATELSYVLQRLCSVSTLWSLPVFVSAWQSLLLSPLAKASLPLADDQMKSCLSSFNLLQRCPVFSELNVTGMVQHFERLQLNVCAAACLIMDPSTPPTLLQERLMKDAGGLIEESYTLTALGFNLPSATQVREEVFRRVVQRGDYHLIPPLALSDFSHFIVRHDDIDGCLLFAITNNMVSQAESLMELYFHYYPHCYDELLAWCASSGYEMESSLQAYIHMKNLA